LKFLTLNNFGYTKESLVSLTQIVNNNPQLEKLDLVFCGSKVHKKTTTGLLTAIASLGKSLKRLRITDLCLN
jgi:hypothetical protein